MGSKSKLAPKAKPSSHFRASDPDMSYGKLKPGTMFASTNFDEFNRGVPGHGQLSPGSYRVEMWSEGDPKKVEIIYTAFRYTSGPNEGWLIPRDITVRNEGVETSFTNLTSS